MEVEDNHRYRTLDELAEAYPTGTRLRFQVSEESGKSGIRMVHGYVWTIPKTGGGPREAGLIIETDFGIGCVYPSEVVAKELPPFSQKETK